MMSVISTTHRPRVVLILERTAAAQRDAPRLANNLRPSRNRERVGDIVRARVDKDEPAEPAPSPAAPSSRTLTTRSTADVRILRVRLAEDAVRAVEQAARLLRRGDVRLRELEARGLQRARVDVVLAPARDRLVRTSTPPVAVTAVGTPVRWMLFGTSEPASLPEEAVEGPYKEASEVEPRGNPFAADLIASLASAVRSCTFGLRASDPPRTPAPRDSSVLRQAPPPRPAAPS